MFVSYVLYLVVFLLGSPTVMIRAELDLYVRDRFLKTNATREKCNVCQEGEGCYSVKTFYVEGQCRQRPAGASVYSRLSESVVCRQDFPGVKCQDSAPSFTATTEQDCGQTWNNSQCEDSIEISVLSDWCRKAEQPSDRFVLPFFEILSYASINDCNQGINVRSDFLPDDPDLCLQVGFFNETEYVYGSRKFHCQGDTARAEKYLDRECSPPALQLPSEIDGTSSQCPTTTDGDDAIFTSTCNSVLIYCKDLYSTDFALQVPGLPSPTPPPTSSSAPAPSASLAPLTMVILLFASSIFLQ